MREFVDQDGNRRRIVASRLLIASCRGLPGFGAPTGRPGELTYTIPGQFKIHYHLCGPNGIPELETFDLKSGRRVLENSTFAYSYPDGTATVIRSCTVYNDSCAPALIQMIGADLVYARREWAREGFKVPSGLIAAGPATLPEIPVYVTDNDDASAAFLGKIWINNTHRFNRKIALHEYFHLVQDAHGSIRSLIADPDSFLPPNPGIEPERFFWSNLESLAQWSAEVLADTHPHYFLLSTVDTFGYPFQQSYAPLIYGYMAERFSRRPVGTVCTGCDTISDYIFNFVEPNGWQSPGLEKFLKAKGVSVNRFIDDFHRDLMLSIYAQPSGSRQFRFANRSAPNVRSWSWPSTLRPIPTATANDWVVCTDPTKAIAERNAAPLPTDPQLKRQTQFCSWNMAASGAAYLRIPLENAKLPKHILLIATLKDRTGYPISDYPPEITTYVAADKGSGATDFRSLEMLGSTTARGLTSEGFNRADAAAGINELHVRVRYPQSRTQTATYKGWMSVRLEIRADWY